MSQDQSEKEQILSLFSAGRVTPKEIGGKSGCVSQR